MRQNGAAGDVIADTDSWAGNDLKRHYNQQRLRSMVSLVLSGRMSSNEAKTLVCGIHTCT